MLSALKVTLIATVFAVVINTVFGIWTAWLLTRFSFKGKQVLATLIDIPFSISDVYKRQDMDCFISMEERMACGIGACLACVCKTKDKDAHSNVNNKRICKEGRCV